MLCVRPSLPGDVPAQRELWRLAFGDEEAYVDNFYRTYYRPERVLVLEEEGQVRAMTAWFDTAFAVPGRGNFRAAYLYAVATHPACRGRGLAGRLLAGADRYFRERSIPAVTTVPAEPSLHRFFAANGFRECFVHHTVHSGPTPGGEGAGFDLRPVSPAAYGAGREALLAGTPHIVYPEEALAYQAGCCALGAGGGLFQADTPEGPALLCAERADGARMVLKELLASPGAAALVLSGGRLCRLLGARTLEVRTPTGAGSGVQFGMLKWLDPALEGAWDWTSTAYLGLGFD